MAAHVGERVFGTSNGVRRNFLVCRERSHVIPVYRLIGHRTETLTTCKCGCPEYVIRRVPELKAAWLVISRLVWRKWVLRKDDWDPRIACRV
jgi:hypothetical protein